MSSWTRLDPEFTEDLRLVEVGAEAAMVFVSGLGYSAYALSDGVIPKREVRRKLWAAPDLDAAVAALLRVGLWVEVDADHYGIAEWENYLQARTVVLEQRAQKAARQKRYMDNLRSKRDASNGASGDASIDALTQRNSTQRRGVEEAVRSRTTAPGGASFGPPLGTEITITGLEDD